MKFNITAYEDVGKTIERFKGICIHLDGIYAYCVEKGSKEIQKISYDRIEYEG